MGIIATLFTFLLATPIFGFELTPPDPELGKGVPVSAPLLLQDGDDDLDFDLDGGSDEDADERSDEDADERSDEDADERSDEDADERSDEDADERSDEDADERSDEDADERSDEDDGSDEGGSGEDYENYEDFDDEDLGDDELGEDDDLDDIDAAMGGEDYAEELRQRADLASRHRIFGILTYISMGVTLAMGGIAYHNQYGAFGDLAETPCVTGDAVFGQGQCTGRSWGHLIGGLATTALYTTTFILASTMPDPDDASSGDSDFAGNLRMHKVLRWVHLFGMIAQMGLGILIANADTMLGLDKANDFGTLQALSTVHLGIGVVTFGAMTWAAALMVF